MKRLKFFILLCGLLLLADGSYGATSGTGCYIQSTGKIYKTLKSGIEYKTSPTISITGNICLFNGAGATCKVKISGSFVFGLAGNWNVLYCPIDDYVWLMLLGFGIIGFSFLRKNSQIIQL